MHIRVDDAVVSGDRGLLDVESMQLVRIAKADGIGERVAFFREYREIQREGAVTAIYSLQGIIINTRSSQDLAVKVVAAVETDGCVEVGVVSWMHRELQRSGAVASMDARIDVGHRIVASHRDGSVETVSRERSSSANRIQQVDNRKRIHGKMENKGVFTTVGDILVTIEIVFARF